jgi:xanthine dehydrogenase accessory factor
MEGEGRRKAADSKSDSFADHSSNRNRNGDAGEWLELGAFDQARYVFPVGESIFQALADAARRGESVALGIITGVKGSSPQKLGAKAIFHADRRIQGTLGGGCLEAEAQRLALNSLKTGKPEVFELVLDHDFGWDDGLICGGKVIGVIVPNAQAVGELFWSDLAKRDVAMTWGVKTDFEIALVDATINHQRSTVNNPDWLYTETISPPCALWIAGSGHIAQAVAPLALQLDFAVSVFDDRPELANRDFFPETASLRTGDWGELCNTPFPIVPTFGLIVTRGHKHDALVLETWIHRPFAFLGMIGSARKARTISEHFIKKKIATAEEIARVACPVGIRIRSQSVVEIAVDIMAQYIDKRAEVEAAKQTSQAGKTQLVQFAE